MMEVYDKEMFPFNRISFKNLVWFCVGRPPIKVDSKCFGFTMGNLEELPPCFDKIKKMILF